MKSISMRIIPVLLVVFPLLSLVSCASMQAENERYQKRQHELELERLKAQGRTSAQPPVQPPAQPPPQQPNVTNIYNPSVPQPPVVNQPPASHAEFYDPMQINISFDNGSPDERYTGRLTVETDNVGDVHMTITWNGREPISGWAKLSGQYQTLEGTDRNGVKAFFEVHAEDSDGPYGGWRLTDPYGNVHTGTWAVYK